MTEAEACDLRAGDYVRSNRGLARVMGRRRGRLDGREYLEMRRADPRRFQPLGQATHWYLPIDQAAQIEHYTGPLPVALD